MTLHLPNLLLLKQIKKERDKEKAEDQQSYRVYVNRLGSILIILLGEMHYEMKIRGGDREFILCVCDVPFFLLIVLYIKVISVFHISFFLFSLC